MTPKPKPRLKSRVEMVNDASPLKLKADPTTDMSGIAVIAECCVRHHPTLALSTWKSSIRQIREALENIEDIYDSAVEEK